jgi:ATP-dependent RNA helicase SUPV3L1/SUV3
MGLNLNIQRVIFTSLEKTKSSGKHRLTQSEVKQIAGRAGRYTEDGKVTTFMKRDLERVNLLINAPVDHLPPKKRSRSDVHFDLFD